MNKNSIDENKAIQDGLERFLEEEIAGQSVSFDSDRNALQNRATTQEKTAVQNRIPNQSVAPGRKELKTEFATEYSGRPMRQGNSIARASSVRTPLYEDVEFEEDTYLQRQREGGRRAQEAEENKARREKAQIEKERKEKEREEREERERREQKRKDRKRRDKKRKEKKDKERKEKRKSGEKKKSSKLKKVLIVLLIVALALLAWWYFMVGKVYNKMNFDENQELATEPMKEDGVINVLLIGNDSRENGEDGRSDAMILLSVSNKTKTIHMTSLLRDMYVDIPGHDGNRLNAAYAYGGPSLLCETIEQNFGIEVNRYVLVNFQAFAKLVDAVGGVDMEVTNEEVQWINAYLNEYNLLEGRELTTDYLDPSLSGEIHLNGPQALAYSRNRYIGTDFGRTERQRKVLSAVMKKLPVALATNSDELINELFPNLTTNMKQSEVFSLSLDAGKLLSYEIIQNVIPAEGTYSNATIRGMSVLEVDFEANKAILQKEIYGKE